jgi:hypothetical protein
MKKRVAMLLLVLGSLMASAQEAPAGPQQEGLPESRPETMKLSSPGLTLYVNYALDGFSPGSPEIWFLDIPAWSKRQVAITGHCEDKDHKGIEKLLIMSGTPVEGADYVILHAVLFDGDKQDERDFILTWDPDDMPWDF